ncbi:thymidine phosphorylase [Candidatus Micrarchaeota archaeon]|nr:thymidine phosphorylase [Candidatus Micrarchaeota archaeon]
MDLFAKVFDIEQGRNEIVLGEAQAAELDLAVLDRVLIRKGDRSAVAIVKHSATFVARGEVGLFHEIALELGAKRGDTVSIEPSQRPASLDYIRKKLDNQVLSAQEITAIIDDLMRQNLSGTELASFVSAVYINGLSTDETAALTQAIYQSGESISPPFEPVVSEHSIGGVAGGRSSLLLVPIMASLGFCVPKTASRAISSAAATADVMEVLAPVSIPARGIEEVLRKAGGCVVWGGAVGIAAADDKLIQVRNPLRLDPLPLVISSILAKKKAEGAQYVVLDIPCGRGVKVTDFNACRDLGREFEVFASRLGIKVAAVVSDGSEPLMNGLGPNLEARGILEILKSGGKAGEPELVEKACHSCGLLLQMVRGVSREEGFATARRQLENGKAFEKFRQIIEAQGGNPDIAPQDIPSGEHRRAFFAEEEGTVAHVDNRAISKILRSVGAPRDKKAGMILAVKKGRRIDRGDELYTLMASTPEALAFGVEMAKKTELIELSRIVLDVV